MKNIETEKKILRNFVKENNKPSTVEDQEIIDRFLNSEFYKNSNSIFITVSFNDEIDTERIIRQAIKDGKSVFIPKTLTRTRAMIPVQINDFPNGLKINNFGILEPVIIPDTVQKEFDLIVVPGLLFSKDGYRLGYGGGYYDRFLADNQSQTLSLCRENQLVETLPYDTFDQKVDILFSKNGFIDTNIKNN